MGELCELLDISQLKTSSYHPQTDGITERFNKTLKEMLANFVNESQDNWDL
jgi:transposase InsO family protein